MPQQSLNFYTRTLHASPGTGLAFGASARRGLGVVRRVAGRGVGLDTSLSAGLSLGAHVGGQCCDAGDGCDFSCRPDDEAD